MLANVPEMPYDVCRFASLAWPGIPITLCAHVTSANAG